MRERKSYSKSFKAQVSHECRQPGVSVAAIAMSHGINARLCTRLLFVQNLGMFQQTEDLPNIIPDFDAEALASHAVDADYACK